MNVLFIGDIIGRPGRWILSQILKPLKEKYRIDFTIANVENAAGGFGLTKAIAQKIMSYGVDVQTTGNHIWDRSEVFPYLDAASDRIIRPSNTPSGAPGVGSCIYTLANGKRVGVINLEGRVFGRNLDCPFRCVDGELLLMRDKTKIIIVDFHAETTSEKGAMAYYLDGRVSLLVGTHTHVQTADERILSGGTAFITDVGMTGGYSGVIGMRVQPVLARFLTSIPHRFSVADGDVKLAGVIAEIDDDTGRARSIQRLMVDFDGKIPADFAYEKGEKIPDGGDS